MNGKGQSMTEFALLMPVLAIVIIAVAALILFITTAWDLSYCASKFQESIWSHRTLGQCLSFSQGDCSGYTCGIYVWPQRVLAGEADTATVGLTSRITQSRMQITIRRQ